MIIRHVLADGRQVKDITGYLLTKENAKEFYKVIAEIGGKKCTKATERESKNSFAM